MLIGATLCYIDNGESYLLLHRNKKENDIHEGKWIGLGGKMEAGESPEDCVIREVYEETGLTIEKPTLRGVITFPKFDGENDWMTFIYVAKRFTGELTACSEGELQWVAYNDILTKPTWEGDYIFLDWLLHKDVFFSGKFCYDNKILSTYDVTFYD